MTATIPKNNEAPVFGSMSAWRYDRIEVCRRIAGECKDVGEFHMVYGCAYLQQLDQV